MRKESLFAGLLALLLMFVFLGCEQANSGTKPKLIQEQNPIPMIAGQK